MAPMRRTQICMPAELNEALDRLARKRGTSKANLIRLAAVRLLALEDAGEEDPILGLIGLGDAGAGRVSEDHDRVLADHALGAKAE